MIIQFNYSNLPPYISHKREWEFNEVTVFCPICKTSVTSVETSVVVLLLIPIEHVLVNQMVWASWLSEVSFSRYEVLFEFVIVVITPMWHIRSSHSFRGSLNSTISSFSYSYVCDWVRDSTAATAATTTSATITQKAKHVCLYKNPYISAIFAQKSKNYMRYGICSKRSFKCDQPEYCNFSRLEIRPGRRWKMMVKVIKL